MRTSPLQTAPWRNAPALLLRQPAVLLAIVAATAVLAIAAASGVLFVSTLDTAALKSAAAQTCPERSMPGFNGQLADGHNAELPAARAAGLRAMNANDPLGTPYAVELGFTQVQNFEVTLYHRPGMLNHVTKLRGGDGPGVWIPDTLSRDLGVEPGGSIATAYQQRLRVAGVYKSLSPSPFVIPDIPRYFCNWTDLIVRSAFAENGTGPFVLADESTVAAASQVVQVSFYDPLPWGSTSTHAAAAANRRGKDAADTFVAATAGYTITAERSSFAEVPIANSGNLNALIVAARKSRSGVSGSVVPIDLAGVLVALLLVAGAGGFWATHRSREIQLLVTRGVTPRALAGKAVLETVPASLVGLAGGIGLAEILVRSLAPASTFEPGATTNAVWAAVGATAVGLLLIALIGAVSSRDRRIGSRRRWWVHLPWELTLAAVAVWLGIDIHRHAGVAVNSTVVHIRGELVIFPMISSLAVLLLLGRLMAVCLPIVRRHLHGGGPAMYLALRRIAGSLAVSVGLVVCVALPTALLTFATTLTTSIEAEVQAKSSTNLGAELVLPVFGLHGKAPSLNGSGTFVVRYNEVDSSLSQRRDAVGSTDADDLAADVLGIDPATFSQFALTDNRQASLVRRLNVVDSAKTVRALLINGSHDYVARSLIIGTSRLPITVVGTDRLFPGLGNGSLPLIVVDRSALAKVDPFASPSSQVWTRSTGSAAVTNAVQRAGGQVSRAPLSGPQLINTTGLLPLTWIFSYLRALGIMIGLVGIAGVVFALASRTRRRTVSYVMSRRMGLTRAAHLRSLVLELTGLAGLGFGLGVAAGSGAFRAILDSLDLYPDLPPGASFDAPGSTWLVSGLVWVGVVLAASAAVQLFADRARPAEILRLE